MLPINQIVKGDVLEVLKTLPDDSIDCIITSPPYWSLRSYLPKDHPDKAKEIGSEPTFKEYLDKMMLVFVEVKRVLKPTGSFWLNMGDSFMSSRPIGTNDNGSHGTLAGGRRTKFSQIKQNGRKKIDNTTAEKSLIGQPWRMAIRCTDELGLILRADINWCKQVLVWRKKEKYTMGSVMPSSVKDRVNMASEHLFHFVKEKKYYYDIDAIRIPSQVVGITDMRPPGILRQRLYPEAKRNKFAFNYRGKFTGNLDAESFNSPRARTQRKSLEARLEDTNDKDTKQSRAGNIKRLLSEVRLGIKPNTGMVGEFDNDYWWKFLLGTSHSNRHYKRGFELMKKWMTENSCYDYSQFYDWVKEYQKGKWSSGTQEEGQGKKWEGVFPFPKPESRNMGKNIPNNWLIGTEPSKEHHFAKFPSKLVEIPILATCPEGGIVLDPFMGSGTTCVAAKMLGRKYIGIEISKEYCQIARDRLRQETLF